MAALNHLVSEAIDVVVHCVRAPDGPRVNTISCVEDQTTGADGTQFTVTEVFARQQRSAPMEWTGDLPTRAQAAFNDAGFDIRAVLGVGKA